jgi:hypothetical protein
MSVDLKNLRKPEAYRFMSDDEYDRFSLEQFRKLELMSEEGFDGSEAAEWAATVITALSRVEQQTP